MLVTRTYLELDVGGADDHAADDHAADRDDLRLDRTALTAPAYRLLYAAVGAAYHWRDRDAWSDAQLRAHLARTDVHVWVAARHGETVGYFELVHDTVAASVEIAYFGLVAAAQGQGLGRRLLERALDEARRLGARRVWLHTCTLDHPAALPNYLRRGFRAVRTEQYEAAVPAGGDAPTFGTGE